MTIGEVARRTGLAASAIRYYESVGLLPQPQRVHGKRRYDDSILAKINVIRMAQQAGFSIAEIHALLHEFPGDAPPSERWQALAGKKMNELDALIQQAQAMKTLLAQTLACRCATLEQCAGESEFRENFDCDAH